MDKDRTGVAPTRPSTDENSVPTSQHNDLLRGLQELANPAPPGTEAREGAPSIFYTRPLREQIEEHESVPKKELFGSFWMERELAILCGQTGAGKSALAFQIALAIAEGRTVGGFGSEGEPAPVLYIDFENDVEDWKERTSGLKVPRNLLRSTLSTDADLDQISLLLAPSILAECARTGARSVILDNISWLFSDAPGKTDIHRETGALMKRLNILRQEHGIAVLVVAHTNKDKGFSTFTLADISGSTNVTRFAQSVFCLAQTLGDESGRYMKQLKARGREREFGGAKVAVSRLEHSNGFLHLARMEHLDTREIDLIREESKSKRAEIEALIDAGKGTKEIAEAMDVTTRYVRSIKSEK